MHRHLDFLHCWQPARWPLADSYHHGMHPEMPARLSPALSILAGIQPYLPVATS
jgi:hypothetical protein